jgi:flagellar M-ring protein FliF
MVDTALTLSPNMPVPSGRGPGIPMAFSRLGDQLPPALRARIVPVAILLGAALAALLIWSLIAASPARQLFPAMAEEDKALVAAALDANGIAYSLDQGSGAIAVAEDDYHRARMLLAAEGLPRAPAAAAGLLDTIPLGSSRAVEGERLRLARESDLARTIEAVEAVEQARVHLAVEQRSAFVRDRSAPAASVMLRLRGGRTLTEAQTQAIVHLVAASVPGLAPDAVSVIDQGGRLLSGAGRAGNSMADQQLRIQAETEERLRQALTSLLTPMVGADNFSAQVNAQLTFDERQATRETYPEAEQRLMREEGSRETGDSGAGIAQGIPGALSNRVPPVPTATDTPPLVAGAPTAGVSANGSTSESYNRQFQWGREVSVTRAASGTVRRLTVAVALANPPGGRPRGTAEINAIRSLVQGAVGYDAARGDVVTVTARVFAPGENGDAAASWKDSPWIDTGIRAGAALLVIIALFFFLVRPMLRAAAARREAAALNPPLLAGPASGAEPPASPAELDRIIGAQNWTERAALVRDFAAQHPDASTQVIHDLLRQKEGADRG